MELYSNNVKKSYSGVSAPKVIGLKFRKPAIHEFGYKTLRDKLIYIGDVVFEAKPLSWFLSRTERSDHSQFLWDSLTFNFPTIDHKIDVFVGSYVRDGSYPIDDSDIKTQTLSEYVFNPTDNSPKEYIHPNSFMNMIKSLALNVEDSGIPVITKNITKDSFLVLYYHTIH